MWIMHTALLPSRPTWKGYVIDLFDQSRGSFHECIFHLNSSAVVACARSLSNMIPYMESHWNTFPSNLNSDGKVAHEIGPGSLLILNRMWTEYPGIVFVTQSHYYEKYFFWIIFNNGSCDIITWVWVSDTNISGHTCTQGCVMKNKSFGMSYLNHCGLVTRCNDTDLSQYWVRW